MSLAEELSGGVDVLVSNAFTAVMAPLHELERKDWDRQLDVNLAGAYLGAKACLPSLRERRGSIVLVSSVHAAADNITNEATWKRSCERCMIVSPSAPCACCQMLPQQRNPWLSARKSRIRRLSIPQRAFGPLLNSEPPRRWHSPWSLHEFVHSQTLPLMS